MGAEDAPEPIRSALAYFQRGGLVEMTERTLEKIADGRTAVECDADGVLALCHLAAEALAARARGRREGIEAAARLTRLRKIKASKSQFNDLLEEVASDIRALSSIPPHEAPK